MGPAGGALPNLAGPEQPRQRGKLRRRLLTGVPPYMRGWQFRVHMLEARTDFWKVMP